MGCGISKTQLEDLAHGRNDAILKDVKEDVEAETCRKSISSIASEGGFLRRVIGSNNEKERGVERELEPGGGRRSISSYSPFREYTLGFKRPHFLENLDEENQIENKKTKDDNIEVEDDKSIDRPSNVEDYSSIALAPGSPSFRVYCVPNDSYEEEEVDDEERQATASSSSSSLSSSSAKESDKEIEGEQAAKRRRGRGIRRAMHGGGSALGLRSVLVQVQRRGSVKFRNLLTKPPSSAPSSDTSTKYLIPKPGE